MEPLPRSVAAESALRAIYRVIGDWMPPDSELDDRDVIVLITQILESHGMPFVATDAFDSVDVEPELPLSGAQDRTMPPPEQPRPPRSAPTNFPAS